MGRFNEGLGKNRTQVKTSGWEKGREAGGVSRCRCGLGVGKKHEKGGRRSVRRGSWVLDKKKDP